MAKKPMTPLQQDIQCYDDQITYIQNCLASQFMDDIRGEMKRINLSRADLALTMDLERSQVSRLLNKAGNPTLRTLVSLASAVDHELSFELRPIHPASHASHPNVIPHEDWRGLLNACDIHESVLSQSEVDFATAETVNW